MEKGEIARYEQFLLFPQCFQKACFSGASKGVIVWEWVNNTHQKIFQKLRSLIKNYLYVEIQQKTVFLCEICIFILKYFLLHKFIWLLFSHSIFLMLMAYCTLHLQMNFLADKLAIRPKILLITSISSFSYYILYPFIDKFHNFYNIKFVFRFRYWIRRLILCG